jgi:hypothetical protein
MKTRLKKFLNVYYIMSEFWKNDFGVIYIVLLPILLLPSFWMFIHEKGKEGGGTRWKKVISCFIIFVTTIVSFVVFGSVKDGHNPWIGSIIIGITLTICTVFSSIFYISKESVERIIEIFLNILDMVEKEKKFFTTIKISFILGCIGYFIVNAITPLWQEKSTKNITNFFISTFFILFMLVVSFGAIDYEAKNKKLPDIFNTMIYRKNITWTLFFISFLILSIVSIVKNRKEADIEKKIQLRRCNVDGYVKSNHGDDSSETCKDVTFNNYKKNINGVEVPFYVFLVFMLSLLFGINSEKIKGVIKKDPPKSLIMFISIGLLIGFISFQIHSDRFTNMNNVKEVSDRGYLIGNIIFAVLGFISFLSLTKLNYNSGDRPDLNNIKANLLWLFQNIKKNMFLSLLFLIGCVLIIALFNGILSKRMLELGVTGTISSLVYWMVGLLLMILVYKFAIKHLENFPAMKLLFNIIFIIPCILFNIVDYLHNDITKTPKLVYMVLLGESLLIGMYVVIPVLMKFLFSLVKIKRTNNELNKLKKEDNKKKASDLQTEIDNIKQPTLIKLTEKNWDEIIDGNFYKDINKTRNYLIQNTNISKKVGNVDINMRKKMEEIEKNFTKITQPSTDFSIKWNNMIEKMVVQKEQWKESCLDVKMDDLSCSLEKAQHNTDICGNIASIIETMGPEFTKISNIDCNLVQYSAYIHIMGELISKNLLEIKSLNEQINSANKKEIFDTNTILVGQPRYMDMEFKTPVKFQNLECKLGSDGSGCALSYNYSISLWVNLHAQPPNMNQSYNKYTNILDYAKNPKISYNMKENKLKIEMKNHATTDLISIFDKNILKMQKWNNIVINYNLGIVEIYINSKLMVSHDVYLPYMKYDKIIIGADKGISGGICNVIYYPSILTKTEIELLYRTLNMKNPPII